MKDAALIKSFPNGITIHLNPEASFEDIIKELTFKFSGSKDFFKNASIILAIEGRTLSEQEELDIVSIIQENTDLTVLGLIGTNEETEQTFLKAMSELTEKLSDPNEGQFYRGTLKNQQCLETDNSIIILGDVNPGSSVISSKNIIILGGLYGQAYAGGNGDNTSFIVALEMEPERLKIADYVYQPSKPSRWSIKQKVAPKIAVVKNNTIALEPLTKNLIDTF